MREYFDDSWEIIDIIEKVILIFDAVYSFNKEKHKHIVDYVLAKKI